MMLYHIIHIRFTRFFLFFTITLTLNLHCTAFNVFADNNGPVDEPKIWLSPGIPIACDASKPEPGTKNEENWLSRNKWWVAIGAVVLGGTAAAVAAGGSNSESDDVNEDNGSYRLDW